MDKNELLAIMLTHLNLDNARRAELIQFFSERDDITVENANLLFLEWSNRNYSNKSNAEEKQGNKVENKYDFVGDLKNGFARVNLGGEWHFSDGVNRQKWFTGGKWGFIDKEGREIVPCQYDDVHDFREGFASVELDGKWGFVDKDGAVVITYKYENAGYFSEGLAPVRMNTKYGFIDKTGQEVIPCKYDGAKRFSEGLAAVKVNDGRLPAFLFGKWGYIDKTGREVIPCKFDNAENFTEGMATVLLDGESLKIDKMGETH